jgi:D-alanyl-D-alanine carboxypeptidase (penicillin-binding protein 5/6)
VLDNLNGKDLDTPFEVNPKSLGVQGTSIYLQRGEKLTIRELLYGMMLRSGNDAAVALALNIAPSIDAFAELMNRTALICGANNSNFKNPHGLDQDGHYTTAYDLAKITAYALKNPTFAEIVATKEIKITGKDYPRVVRNKNRLLQSTADCVGVKTGFTKKAGRCYVGAFNNNGMTVICVVLNCGPMFEEAASLMEMADEEYTLTRVFDKGQVVGDRNDKKNELYLPLKSGEYPKISWDGDVLSVSIEGESVYTMSCESINTSPLAAKHQGETPKTLSKAAE